jgi:hypothetical protein
VQGAQRLAHRAILGPAIATATPAPTGPVGMADDGGLAPAPLASLPFPLRMLQRFPVLQGIPARLVAIGPLPEHAPEWARREPEPVARP